MPLTEDRLETVWEAARAGLIDWASVQQVQAGMMPRCANHRDRAAPAIWEGKAVCVGCVEAIAAARREEHGSVR